MKLIYAPEIFYVDLSHSRKKWINPENANGWKYCQLPLEGYFQF